ncbi:MAG TPA: ABC transporter permease [Phycisphaerae bacterium]|jgi:peptide/nickel transport system permease protein
MFRFLRRRLAFALITLLGISLINFALISAVPGDPVAGNSDENVSATDASSRALIRAQFHLDEPRWKRYALWMRDLLSGNLGVSLETREPVGARLRPALWNTLSLNVVAIFVVYLIAVPLGALAAAHRGRVFDAVSGVVLFGLYSLPNFWVGTLLLIFLAGGKYLNWFPAHGLQPDSFQDSGLLRHWIAAIPYYVLPVTTLAYFQLAALSRYARTGFLEALGQDFIRTARAKGLSATAVLWKHAARNSLIPVVTEFGAVLPMLISGSIVVESIFSIPGMGRLAVVAVFARDYPMILAINLLLALLTLAGMILTDLLYAWLDPRIELA